MSEARTAPRPEPGRIFRDQHQPAADLAERDPIAAWAADFRRRITTPQEQNEEAE